MVLGHGRPQPCRGEIPHVRDPSGNTPRFFHPPFFLHTFPQILPTHTSDGASRQLLNRPRLRVWHHGGRRAEAEGFTRSSRGDHLSDPLLPEPPGEGAGMAPMELCSNAGAQRALLCRGRL